MATRRKVKEIAEDSRPVMKIQLDYKTVITLRDPDKLEFWKQKYPKLQILD
jgi:hypothetical protein